MGPCPLTEERKTLIAVISIAGAAALAVIAYGHVRSRSPEASTAGLRAIRELAAVVLVCVKAVEGVVDVLAGHQRLQAAPSQWGGYQPSYYDLDEEQP